MAEATSASRDLATIAWSCKPWAALTLDELYEALALRCRVFILEQGPYQDPDGLDQISLHVFGRDAAGTLQAYCRLVAPGHKYGEPSMGRVIVSPEWRGTGLGHPLVAEALRAADATWVLALSHRTPVLVYLNGRLLANSVPLPDADLPPRNLQIGDRPLLANVPADWLTAGEHVLAVRVGIDTSQVRCLPG